MNHPIPTPGQSFLWPLSRTQAGQPIRSTPESRQIKRVVRVKTRRHIEGTRTHRYNLQLATAQEVLILCGAVVETLRREDSLVEARQYLERPEAHEEIWVPNSHCVELARGRASLDVWALTFAGRPAEPGWTFIRRKEIGLCVRVPRCCNCL